VGGRSGRRRRLEREALTRDVGRPLRVVLLTRTGRRSSGGIGRSGQLIQAALERLGNKVRVRNVREPLVDIPSDTDLVWHYGDYDLVDEQAAACREAAVPLLINSTYDGTSDRRRWMYDLAERTGAFLVVFAHSARDDITLHGMRERLVVVPKTIRCADVLPEAGFEERIGIGLGELEKLRRPRLIRGLDVDEAVEALREALPEAPLYAYDQYATVATVPPAGVEIVSPGADMLGWLGGLRLCVSLSVHETFSMVPAEAQSVGTPVLYRPMRQGLSEQLGQTALVFETVEQLALQAQLIYRDAERWQALHDSARHNALARGVDVCHVALDLALRKVVMA
jgi:glycosyltransferase involved in cell wall biosynthesis